MNRSLCATKLFSIFFFILLIINIKLSCTSTRSQYTMCASVYQNRAEIILLLVAYHHWQNQIYRTECIFGCPLADFVFFRTDFFFMEMMIFFLRWLLSIHNKAEEKKRFLFWFGAVFGACVNVSVCVVWHFLASIASPSCFKKNVEKNVFKKKEIFFLCSLSKYLLFSLNCNRCIFGVKTILFFRWLIFIRFYCLCWNGWDGWHVDMYLGVDFLSHLH